MQELELNSASLWGNVMMTDIWKHANEDFVMLRLTVQQDELDVHSKQILRGVAGHYIIFT